jgi:hypothetical protein
VILRSRAIAIRISMLALLSAAGLACGPGPSNDNPFPPPPPVTGVGGTIGPPPSGTVSVVINTPQPGGGPVFPGTLIDVSADVTVTGGSDFIDGTSVQIVVTAMGSTQPVDTGLLVITTGDTYAGRVSLGGELKSGVYTVTVNARSSGGAVGTASVDINVDAGPVLIVTSPIEGKSYKRSLTIEVIATDEFGLKTDGSGYPLPPTATVGAIDVPLSPIGMDTYRGMIDFDAQNPPLFGSQLLTVAVTNVNERRAEVQVIFLIDNEGPTITNTQPVPGQIVGGIVPISARIGDNAGVLDSSVIAVIADETGTPLFELPLKPAGAGVYTVLFDSSRFKKCPDPPVRGQGECLVFPTISFRAADLVGNETAIGYAFALDNVAPVSDLDSANVRVIRRDGYCSQEFDPLARNTNPGDMPNDRAVAPQVFDLRARIQDDGNSAAVGLKGIPIAGIDPDATSVYILDDTARPLIVDVDGDGTCDIINPELIPTTQPPTMNNQVLKVRLAGVPAQGAPDYRDDGNTPDPSICTYPPVALPPLAICPTNQPFMAISYSEGLPAIWSVEPITPFWCMGYQFDARANNISQGSGAGDANGWACLAVQSSDRSGNTSVSPPLRIYIRYDGGLSTPGVGQAGQPAPTSFGAPPPCTGVVDQNTGAVMPGACTTRRYGSVNYIVEKF